MDFIALKMLLGDRGKYIAMIVGLTFAAIIMTQQPAIFVGLMKRTYSYIDEISLPDIWVMDPSIEYVEENKPLRDIELQRVRGVSGVLWAAPLNMSVLTALLPDGTRKILGLTGLEDATLVGAPKILTAGSLSDLRREDAIIIDQETAEKRFAYTGADGKKHPLTIGSVLEINDRRAVIVGIAKLKRTFTTLPLAYTTFTRSLHYAPPQRRMLSYVLVKAKPGSDIQEVANRIHRETQLTALTTEQFRKANYTYWMDNTGIPVNFGISVLLGFLVGAAVAGQTFFNFIRENLKQFAALKAMGVQRGTLIRMVLIQAGIVGAIGYGLGVGLSALFGLALTNSALAFSMPLPLLLFSASGIALIVGVSALLGIRSIIKLDPATVFRA